MKGLVGFGLSLLLAASAAAQFGGGALGGHYASRGISHPLGGIRTPGRPIPGPRTGVYAFPFAYSTYVPNYFDSLNYDYWGGQSYAAPPPSYYPGTQYYPGPAPAPPAPPVIINQYFGADNSLQPPPSDLGGGLNTYRAPSAPVPTGPSQAAGSDVVENPQNYYLIAYKDHSIYTVLAYWLEGDVLNYVTTQNTHNQASLKLIDLDLTKTLNQARGVAFTISGR